MTHCLVFCCSVLDRNVDGYVAANDDQYIHLRIDVCVCVRVRVCVAENGQIHQSILIKHFASERTSPRSPQDLLDVCKILVKIFKNLSENVTRQDLFQNLARFNKITRS